MQHIEPKLLNKSLAHSTLQVARHRTGCKSGIIAETASELQTLIKAINGEQPLIAWVSAELLMVHVLLPTVD